MIEFIYNYEFLFRAGAAVGGLALLGLAETYMPKRALLRPRFNRWLNNLSLTVINTALLRLLVPTVAIGMAFVVEQNHWGMIYHGHVHVPYWLAVVVSILLLDLSLYSQHIVFHVLPFMWRFHRVHHTDLDFDVSTGLRFHPVEILVSILIRLTMIMMLGAPVLAVILFEAVHGLMLMLTHANVRLNTSLERMVRWLFVTPDMHRIHHSARENETNSNFGLSLSVWDRLFGTYIAEPKFGHQEMTIGLDRFRGERWQGLGALLALPFTRKVYSYAINIRDTRNEEELEMVREMAEEHKEHARLSSQLSGYVQALNQHALVSATDLDGNIISVNQKFCDTTGYSEQELLGENHRMISSGKHSKSFYQDMWNTIIGGNVWRGEICNRAKNGDLFWMDSTIVPFLSDDGKIKGYMSARVDITDRKRQEKEMLETLNELAEVNSQLEALNQVDSLTGVANRRCFDQTLRSEISRMSRVSAPLTLILCDVDYFKNYNDHYGHVGGDACLKNVAECIASCVSRAGDLVARYGGEEFAVILPNVNTENGLLMAERIRSRIEELAIEHQASSIAGVVTVSTGLISTVPGRHTTSKDLINAADKALYEAKQTGRNQVRLSGEQDVRLASQPDR